MKPTAMSCRIVIGAFALMVACLQGQSASTLPHLEKRGAATQLIVDGKP